MSRFTAFSSDFNQQANFHMLNVFCVLQTTFGDCILAWGRLRPLKYVYSGTLHETILRLNNEYHYIVQNMDRVLVKEGSMADDRLILGRNGYKNK